MNQSDKQLFISNKLKKAQAVLLQIQSLISFNFHDVSVNRMYYACFYCSQALVAVHDAYPKSHKGLLTLFQQHYVKEQKFPLALAYFYQDIFHQRQMADYSDEFVIDQETVHHFFEQANAFVAETKSILRQYT